MLLFVHGQRQLEVAIGSFYQSTMPIPDRAVEACCAFNLMLYVM
jgi:hypothetical protein